MAFNNPAANLIVPSDALPGQSRIVLGPDVPSELTAYYNTNAITLEVVILFFGVNLGYGYIGVTSTGSLVRGAVTDNLQVSEVDNLNYSIGQIASLAYGAYNPQTITYTAGSVISIIEGTKGSRSTSFRSGVPLYLQSAGVVESWNALSYLNGWTNATSLTAGQYRKVVSPPNTVQMVGALTPSVTNSNGTQIATMPVGYRPTNVITVPVSCDVTVSGGQSPHFDIESTGAVKVWGLASATLVSFDFTYPVDAS